MVSASTYATIVYMKMMIVANPLLWVPIFATGGSKLIEARPLEFCPSGRKKSCRNRTNYGSRARSCHPL